MDIAYSDQYQRAIDFGGHPNERAILGSRYDEQRDDRTMLGQVYLAEPSLAFQRGIWSTIQAQALVANLVTIALPERAANDQVVQELRAARAHL
jgi:hypothetical protein